MDIPLRQMKSRPHASQVLIAQPHPTAMFQFQMLLVDPVDAAVHVPLAAAAPARVVVDTPLVGGKPFLNVRRPGGHAFLGGAGPQHPHANISEPGECLTHECLV